jgi:hypothetical protein
MSTIGLIVNPGASRDVRRLTSLARTIDANEQANTVARVLCGLAAGGVESVVYMAEPSHVVERARDVLMATPAAAMWAAPGLRPVQLGGDGYAHDAAGTTTTAAAMAAMGAACVVTLGGDGTNRAVVEGWPDAVLVPLPGGTNNAFGTWLDPAAAGYAAALYAADPEAHQADVVTRPRLDVEIRGRAMIALVDVAIVRGGWVGAHAIWDPDLLVEAVVARSDPAVPGLAGVAGMVCPLAEGDMRGVHLRFARGGRSVIAPLGPGQFVSVHIDASGTFGPGDVLEIPDRRDPGAGSRTMAFDGEREVTLDHGEVALVRLAVAGPRVLEGAALLRRAASEGRLVGPGPVGVG